ncbi:unnamed protein product, partial [Phaeothamnion confervicola]
MVLAETLPPGFHLLNYYQEAIQKGKYRAKAIAEARGVKTPLVISAYIPTRKGRCDRAAERRFIDERCTTGAWEALVAGQRTLPSSAHDDDEDADATAAAPPPREADTPRESKKRAIDAFGEEAAVRATHDEANWGGARLGSGRPVDAFGARRMRAVRRALKLAETANAERAAREELLQLCRDLGFGGNRIERLNGCVERSNRDASWYQKRYKKARAEQQMKRDAKREVEMAERTAACFRFREEDAIPHFEGVMAAVNCTTHDARVRRARREAAAAAAEGVAEPTEQPSILDLDGRSAAQVLNTYLKAQALRFLYTLLNKGVARDAALDFAAEATGKAATTIAGWEAEYLRNGAIGMSEQGMWPEQEWLLEREDLVEACKERLRTHASVRGQPNMRAEDFALWFNRAHMSQLEHLHNNPPPTPADAPLGAEYDVFKGLSMKRVEGADGVVRREISVRTAQLWMHKLGAGFVTQRKGVYVDGHDRDDVLDYRNGVKLMLPPSKTFNLRQDSF